MTACHPQLPHSAPACSRLEFREYRVLPPERNFAVRRMMLQRLWRQFNKPAPGLPPRESENKSPPD